jgi:hypothetical protein
MARRQEGFGMAFLFGKLVFLVLRPSNLFLIAALAGLTGVAWRRRWGMSLLAGGVIVIALCTVLPVGLWLTVPLEERFPAPADLPAEVDGIVVLGGGIDGRLTKARGQPSFGETMERFASIPELIHRYPAAKVVFTGGVGWTGGDVDEAQVIALFLALQGVPEGRVALEGEARSTGTTRSSPYRWRSRSRASGGSWSRRPHICHVRSGRSGEPVGQRWRLGPSTTEPMAPSSCSGSPVWLRAGSARSGCLRVVWPRLLLDTWIYGRDLARASAHLRTSR